MSFLLTDKIPFFVTFLLSLLGWHVVQLIDEVRSQNAVTYKIETSSDIYEVTIHNVSKKRSLIGATFQVSCPDMKPCIKPGSPEIVAYPPTFVPPVETGSDSSYASVTATMGVDGKFGMKMQRNAGQPAPKFIFMPDDEKPIDIYMINANSLSGRVVSHYPAILATTFVILLLTLGVTLILMHKKTRVVPSGDAKPEDAPVQAATPLAAATQEGATK